MAARVLLQRLSVVPLASLALGGMALVPATALAEAPSEKRKPIYDDIEAAPKSGSVLPSLPSITTPSRETSIENDDSTGKKPRGPTPTDRLAAQIGHARLFLYRCVVAAEDKVNQTLDSVFDLEQSFTRTIASLAPPRESGEKLMPGTIYVLVAAMAGSIITRRRNILLRATVPLALGIGAGWTVLPITMRNMSDLAWKYEKKFPVVADTHTRVRESLDRGFGFAKVHSQIGVQYVDEKVTDAREAVEGWVKQGK